MLIELFSEDLFSIFILGKLTRNDDKLIKKKLWNIKLFWSKNWGKSEKRLRYFFLKLKYMMDR